MSPETTSKGFWLTKEKLETLSVIYDIVKDRRPRHFTTNEIVEKLREKNPKINYLTVIMRLQRLKKRGTIRQISRGLYIIDEETYKLIEKIFSGKEKDKKPIT